MDNVEMPPHAVGIYLPDSIVCQVRQPTQMYRLLPSEFEELGFLALGWWERCHTVIASASSVRSEQ